MRNRYATVALDALLSLSFLALVLINMITMPMCATFVVHALSAGNHLAAIAAFGFGWACVTLLLIVANSYGGRRRNADASTSPHPIAS